MILRRSRTVLTQLGMPYVAVGYLNLALTFPFAVLTARALGPETKGLWSVIVQLAFFAELTATWGIGGLVLRDGREAGALHRVLRAHVPIMLTGLALASVSLIALVSPFGALYRPSVVSTVLSLGGLVLLIASRPLQQATIALDDVRAYAGSSLGQSVVQLGAAATLYVVLGPSLAVTLAAWVLGLLVRMSIPGLALRRDSRALERLTTHELRNQRRANLRFGLARVPTELADTAATRLSLVILPAFTSDARVGQWSVTIALFEIGALASQMLANLGLRRLSDGGAHPMRLVHSLAVTLGAMVVMALLSPIVVPAVFGEAYVDAADTLVLVAPLLLPLAFMRWRTTQLTVVGREKAARRVSLAAMVMTPIGALGSAAIGWAVGPGALALGTLVGAALAEREWRLRD